MNPNNNHLVSGEKFKELLSSAPSYANNFVPIVKDALAKEAEKALDGKEEVFIPMKSKSPLAKWAAKVRKNNGINLD